MDPAKVAKRFRSLYPDELLYRYKDGERDFRRINLLRTELESYLISREYFKGRAICMCVDFKDQKIYYFLAVPKVMDRTLCFST